jgi:hypothetical protein
LLDELENVLKERTCVFSIKNFRLACYRNVEEATVKELFLKILTKTRVWKEGVIEVRPNIDWHKGKAIEKIFKIAYKNGFRAVNAVRVGYVDKTDAKYFLKDTDEVKEFLAFELKRVLFLVFSYLSCNLR